MFELEQAISDWRREMQCRGVKGAETLDELESHLRDDLEEQVRWGRETEEAFETARAHIGKTHSLQMEFEKVKLTELFHRLKHALLTLIGVPNYNLITNMNTSFSSPGAEARWPSYLKAGTFLTPSLILWMFSCVFMMPKLKEICGNAGFALPTVLQATLFATAHPVLVLAAIALPFLFLEWRSTGWPRYRRITLGTGVFLINALILLVITMMVFSALVAAPAMAHLTK
jgi:hypothetical protein